MLRSIISQFFINGIKFFKQKQPAPIQQKQRKPNLELKTVLRTSKTQ